MNTYRKYCPNVFVAECEEKHEKGEVITLTTKYGKENEHIVHNLVSERNGKFYYSITRADGFNSQERARGKIEKLEGYASNAESRGDNFVNASREGREFLSLGEPIKVGHHSEKRHRALIERNNNRMGKAVQEYDKANEYRDRMEYWEEKAGKIDLSMPESIEYFKHELEKAVARHEGLKAGTIEREHAYSLTYAKKERNELEKKYNQALILWGDKGGNV